MTWLRAGYLHDFTVRSHAQCPTVLVMDDRLRVFYADRTAENKSWIAYVDVDRAVPTRVIGHKAMITTLGARGMFDEDGMMPSCAVKDGDGYALYYSGWNQGGSVPYRNAIGLLTSNDGEHWERVSDGPALDRSQFDPIMCVTPWVQKIKENWRMYYVSGTRWEMIDGHLEPIYVIKYATWAGRWAPMGITCIQPEHDSEAFSNPTIFRRDGKYQMLFCSRDSRDYRGGAGSYRIRSAESVDGVTWKRTNNGLDVSSSGGDSEMTCYPYVVEVDGRLLCYYNGNQFGKTGIFLAVWKDE